MKCPNCNYTSELNFDLCPNCGYKNSNNSMDNGIVIFDGNTNNNVNDVPVDVPVVLDNANDSVQIIPEPVQSVSNSVQTDAIQPISAPVQPVIDSVQPVTNQVDNIPNVDEEEVEVGGGGYYNNVPDIPLMPNLNNISQVQNQNINTNTNSGQQIIPQTPVVNNDNSASQVKEAEPVVVVPNPTINQIIPNEPLPQMAGMNANNQNIGTIQNNTNTNNNQTPVAKPKKEKRKFFLDLETIFILVICIASAYAFITYLPIYLKYNNYGDKLESNINLNYVYDAERPILYKTKDEKYKYLTTSGANLVDKTYTYATDFYGEYAIVNTTNDEDYTHVFINKKGEELLKIKNLSLLYNDKNNNVYLVDGILYDNKLKRITENNLEISYMNGKFYKYFDNITKKEGIINSLGTILYEFEKSPYKYELRSVTKSKVDNYLEAYYINGDTISMELISLATLDKLLKLENVDNYGYSFNDGLVEYYNINNGSEKKYLYLHNGEIAYKNDNVFSISKENNYNNVLKINKSQTEYEYYDVISKKSYKELPKELVYSQNIDNYGYDLSYDLDAKKVGLVNSKNETILESKYDEIEFLDLSLYLYIRARGHADLFILKSNDDATISVYDARSKKIIVEYKNAEIILNRDSTFAYFKIYENNNILNYVVYNLLTYKDLNVTTEEKFDIYNNYFKVDNGKFVKYYNTRMTNFYSEKVGG